MNAEVVLPKPGSVVTCFDGTLSHAGGIQGACSHHGGVAGSPIKAAVTSAPAIAARTQASVMRVQPTAPSVRAMWILVGVSGLTGVAFIAANKLKARRDAQQRAE